MPLLQTAKHLRVGLVDIEHKDYEIKFFKASQEVHLQNVKEQKRSLGSTGALASSQYFALQEPFDYLQLVQEGRYPAIILPKWRKVANQSMRAAFDVSDSYHRSVDGLVTFTGDDNLGQKAFGDTVAIGVDGQLVVAFKIA